MAGNEWINGYLEAILDAGPKKLDREAFAISQSESLSADVVPLVPRLAFSPTKYFVEEVINSFDEADLYKTWVKVVAMRNTKERSNRLENMCWRIWNLARQKKKIEVDGASGLTKRRRELEQGRKDAAGDISELSEGENKSSRGDRVMTSDFRVWSSEDDSKRVYIVLISLHGLVRGENMELGRDSDTGGQVKYVVELARALAATKGVHRVDLLTRQISDPDVDWSYGEPVEMLTRPSDLTGEDACGAYIIRLPCGPQDKYVPKESLWPYILEFVDRALAHIIDVSRAIGDQLEDGSTHPIWPYVIHGHYADAADVAARLSGILNVPMVFTGHSLGRNKFEQLLKQGRMSRADINSTYKIMRRIEAEEFGLDSAELVVTSTRQEIEEQWGLYDGFDTKIERKLRVRRRRGVSCLGRHMPRFMVIPPGMDFSYVNQQDLSETDVDLKTLIGSNVVPSNTGSGNGSGRKKKLPPIWSEVMRFLTNSHKPMILALSRPDPKKNVTTLLKAFGESQHLRQLANLTLILGNRDDLEEMAGGSSMVLTTVLKLIDRYDLYGQVAYPKHHKQSDVPEIYRLAAKTKGVFVNPALVEPFGLTVIEAAAYGLPVVATKNGGPVDILKTLNNGLLIDPHDHNAISEALLKLVADKNLWQECRKNGLKNIHRFSWPEHCKTYLSCVEYCRSRHPATRLISPRIQEEPMSESLKGIEDLSIRFSIDIATAATAATASSFDHSDVITAATLLDALQRNHSERVMNGIKPLVSYSPGGRKRLLVIAADCYHGDGNFATDELNTLIKGVAAISEKFGGEFGLVFATGSTMTETVEALKVCGMSATDFDALICNSGGELYLPWKSHDVVAEEDYATHVKYRWPKEHVKLSAQKLASSEDAVEKEDGLTVVEEACGGNSYVYRLKPGEKTRKLDKIRQSLRMRGFRCNLVYTRGGSRLIALPLFASRAHALRYLWIRWGIELGKMMVFVGEKGDSDYEELLLGLQKTAIIKGIVKLGSENLIRQDDSYKREDVVDEESPHVGLVENFGEDGMSAVLKNLGVNY